MPRITKTDRINDLIATYNVQGDALELLESWKDEIKRKNEHKSTSTNKKTQENAEMRTQIENLLLGGEHLRATEIGARLGITQNRASTLANQLVKDTDSLVSKGKEKGNTVFFIVAE